MYSEGVKGALPGCVFNEEVGDVEEVVDDCDSVELGEGDGLLPYLCFFLFGFHPRVVSASDRLASTPVRWSEREKKRPSPSIFFSSSKKRESSLAL